MENGEWRMEHGAWSMEAIFSSSFTKNGSYVGMEILDGAGEKECRENY